MIIAKSRDSDRFFGIQLNDPTKGTLSSTPVDPFLKNLQHDPRYAALLKKLHFPA